MAINLGNLFVNTDGGVLSDKSGNHIATSAGSVFQDNSVTKFSDNSMNFTVTSNDNHFTVPNHVDFQPSSVGGVGFTLDFWFILTPIVTSRWQVLMSTANDGTWTDGWLVLVDQADNLMKVYCKHLGITYGDLVIPTRVDDGQWHHYAWTVDGNIGKVYLDGQLAATHTLVGDVTTTATHDFHVGQTYGWPAGQFTGYLDNVRITQGEVLWTSNFNLEAYDLFYQLPDYNPNRYDLVTKLYNMSSVKGNLRGKALAGYIRPTIRELFTSKNYANTLRDTTPNDDFSRSTLDSYRWYTYSSNEDTTMVQSGGSLNIDLPNTPDTVDSAALISKFKFTGDFELIFTFKDLVNPKAYDDILRVEIMDLADQQIGLQTDFRPDYSYTNGYVSRYISQGAWSNNNGGGGWHDINPMKIKLKRLNNILYIYAWSSSYGDWMNVSGWTVTVTEPDQVRPLSVRITLLSMSTSSNALSVSVDDCEYVSGDYIY